MSKLSEIKLSSKLSALLIVGAILLVAVICGGYFWLYYKEIKEKPPSVLLQKKAGIKQIPLNELPRLLPPDIPLEKNALILQNYSQVIGNREQATRQFLSSKSLKENFEIYQNYLKNKNWSIISTVDGPDLKSLAARKERPPDVISITISKNKQTNQVIVDITLVGPALIKKD
jgi:hypothetical protein